MCLFWEVQLVDSSLSLPPGMLRSMPMVFPGLRTLNWTRCWMTGFEWFWCSHFVLWAVLHARQDSFFKFQSTTRKKKLKKLKLANNIEYLPISANVFCCQERCLSDLLLLWWKQGENSHGQRGHLLKQAQLQTGHGICNQECLFGYQRWSARCERSRIELGIKDVRICSMIQVDSIRFPSSPI